jgi:hypothetical protein
MRKLLFVLILDFLCTTSFSQLNQSFLQKQLPQAIQSNSELLKQVSQTLQRDVSLYPDILAYRLNYYKRLFIQGIKDNNENGLNNLNLITAHYYNMRNEWIRNQQQVITYITFNNNYKELSIDFLENFYVEIADSLNQPELYLDKNIVDYYALFAFDDQIIEKYDSHIDYSPERNKIQENILEDYIKELNERGKNRPEEFLEKLIDHWYLFDENLANQKIISDYILNYFSSLYSIDKLSVNTLYIGATYFVLNDGIDIKFNQPINSTENIIGSLSKTVLVDLDISHKFPLKDELSILSFLNIGLSVSSILSQNVKGIEPKMVYFRNIEEKPEYISETWTFNQLSINDIQAFSTNLQASMPIVFFKNYMYLEVGAKFGFDFYTYSLNTKYSYGKVEVVWDPNQQRYIRNILESVPSGNSSEKKIISNFILYPTIGFTVDKFNPILIQFSASYNNISAKVGCSF